MKRRDIKEEDKDKDFESLLRWYDNVATAAATFPPLLSPSLLTKGGGGIT